MKNVLKLFIVAVTLSLFAPNSSHAFGIFQYAFDGIKNQLGLDRGPVSKVVPNEDPNNPYCHPATANPLTPRAHPDRNRMVIQAEGF